MFFPKFFTKRLSPSYFRPVENDDNEIVVTLDENLRFCRFFFWCGVRFLKKNVLVFRGCCLCTAVKVNLLTEVTVELPNIDNPRTTLELDTPKMRRRNMPVRHSPDSLPHVWTSEVWSFQFYFILFRCDSVSESENLSGQCSPELPCFGSGFRFC